jgi:two-component system NtrC family sensor kinase
MKDLLRRFVPRTLAHRLILFVVVAFLVVGFFAGYLHVRTQEQQLLETIITGADQLSNGISSATWHAMLADNRTAAYEIMHTIATRQGIERIRIFNREGLVMYSTNPSDSGTFPKTADPCVICHSSVDPLSIVEPHARSRIFQETGGHRRLAMVTPIYNEPACSNADCHAHPPSVKVLGVLDVTYGLEYVDDVIVEIQSRVFFVTLSASILASVVLTILIRRTVHRPISQLIEGTRAVAELDWEHSLPISTSGDFHELIKSFDMMRKRLKTAIDDLNEMTATLEEKVQKRTVELDHMHEKLSQSDRLASLGQLAASVAHEINNPIAGVLNLASLLQRIMTTEGIPRERVEEVRKYFEQIASETARVGRIVQDLLAFSRRSTPQQVNVDLNDIIRRTISILNHKLELMGVTLNLQLNEQAVSVRCDASQMQQVIVNLVMNAAEATMSKGNGRVEIRTVPDPARHCVVFEVADNGDGIATENLRKVFDPFFTTKAEGKGTGLGLAVVYGIINAHGGEIKVDSKVGTGTTFRIELPMPQQFPERTFNG